MSWYANWFWCENCGQYADAGDFINRLCLECCGTGSELGRKTLQLEREDDIIDVGKATSKI